MCKPHGSWTWAAEQEFGGLMWQSEYLRASHPYGLDPELMALSRRFPHGVHVGLDLNRIQPE